MSHGLKVGGLIRVFSMLNVLFVFQVWAAVPPWKQGSLAEYVTLTEYEVSYRASRVVSLRYIFIINYVVLFLQVDCFACSLLCRDKVSFGRKKIGPT